MRDARGFSVLCVDDRIQTVKKLAFLTTATQLRRTGDNNPTFAVARRIALRAVNRLAAPGRLYLDQEHVDKIADGIASYIEQKWEPRSVRRPIDISRGERRNSRRAIAAAAVTKAGPAAPTRRALADSLKTSNSKVQRTLLNQGLARPWQKKALSIPAKMVMEVLAEHTPVDGKRVLDRTQLATAANVSLDKCSEVFDEINKAKISTYITETNTPSLRGSKWIVVSRGRKMKSEATQEWFERVILKNENSRRNWLMPDQRIFTLDLRPPSAGQEERDILSVIMVSNYRSQISEWRRFLQISIDRKNTEDPEFDEEAILNVIHSGFRVPNKKFEDLELSEWLTVQAESKAAAQIISLVKEIRKIRLSALSQALTYWAGVIELEKRFADGLLPGRTLARFQELMAASETDEEAFFDNLFLKPEAIINDKQDDDDWDAYYEAELGDAEPGYTYGPDDP